MFSDIEVRVFHAHFNVLILVSHGGCLGLQLIGHLAGVATGRPSSTSESFVADLVVNGGTSLTKPATNDQWTSVVN